MNERAWIAIALALVLVIAGCAAPSHEVTPGRATTRSPGDTPTGTGPSAPGETPTGAATPDGSDGGIEVVGGSLPVDPDVVFERVTRLMGATVSPPETVRVIPRDELSTSGNGTSSLSLVPTFFRTVDVDTDPGEGLNATAAANLENGATSLAVGTVTILLGENDSETVHYVLAHEFVHYVQAARGRAAQLRRELTGTTDADAVFGSLLEGAAVYTTNAYIEKYIGGGLTNSELYFELRARLAPGSYARYVNARYIYGWRYVAWRVPAPNATDEIYENPPHTSEQVIHRLVPAEEPPVPLTVSAATGAYRRIGTDRMGEAFLRAFLQNGLDPARAARAAAGWGNDTVRIYRAPGRNRPAYAWAIRFDDRANRTGFLDAIRDSLAARGTRSNGTWTVTESWASFDVRPVGPDAVVVLVGTDEFVRATTVGGEASSITIDLPGSRATSGSPRRKT